MISIIDGPGIADDSDLRWHFVKKLEVIDVIVIDVTIILQKSEVHANFNH